jgi:hypothetical protein
VLYEVNAQHALQGHRLGAIAGLGVMRLDQTAQRLPGNDCVHLGKKTLAARHLALVLPGQRLEGRLLHRPTATATCTQYRSSRNTCAEVP